MKVELKDNYVFDDAANIRITDDGYLIATPRIARTGIQPYLGSEIGLVGDDARKALKIYRPEHEVFKLDAMRSLAHRPITDNHPPVSVTADNWKKYAVGQSGEDVARDGHFIRVPMVLMDQKIIDKVRAGKAELSVGYDVEVYMVPGTTPDGMAYDGYQQNIRANHIAVVDAARGGPELRIGDDLDPLQQAIRDARMAQRVEQFDASHAGHRPGFRFADAAATTTSEQRRSERERVLADAWKRPPLIIDQQTSRPSDTAPGTFTHDELLARRDKRLEDAWTK
ncbi:hypothetical protein ABIE93_001418 [Bradyrhizobium elkanii]|uniref:DUF2213 domain-containing protein n=1 Tax=Bradyrhizobium elkanii TaxID=29448 RepID=UPI0035124B25